MIQHFFLRLNWKKVINFVIGNGGGYDEKYGSPRRGGGGDMMYNKVMSVDSIVIDGAGDDVDDVGNNEEEMDGILIKSQREKPFVD